MLFSGIIVAASQLTGTLLYTAKGMPHTEIGPVKHQSMQISAAVKQTFKQESECSRAELRGG